MSQQDIKTVVEIDQDCVCVRKIWTLTRPATKEHTPSASMIEAGNSGAAMMMGKAKTIAARSSAPIAETALEDRARLGVKALRRFGQSRRLGMVGSTVVVFDDDEEDTDLCMIRDRTPAACCVRGRAPDQQVSGSRRSGGRHTATRALLL